MAIVATNQVAGANTITITKQIVDANNAPVVGADVSGFTFSVTNTAGFNQTVTTPASGTVTLSNLAVGTYTVTEQARAGYTLSSAAVDGVAVVGTVATFNLAAGQPPRNVTFANRQGGATGTVTIRKELVDATNNVTTGTLSGFSFTVQCAAAGTTQAFSQTVVSDASGNASVANVPAGSCTLLENLPSGSNFTFVSATPAGGAASTTNPTAITVTAGQTLNVVVRNRTGGTPSETQQVPLSAGCNNVSLTWTAGTPITTVAAAISPANALESIWRYDNAAGQFVGFSPNPNAPSDYRAIQVFLEPVFICMRAPGTIARPVV